MASRSKCLDLRDEHVANILAESTIQLPRRGGRYDDNVDRHDHHLRHHIRYITALQRGTEEEEEEDPTDIPVSEFRLGKDVTNTLSRSNFIRSLS
jgi:hypothetical protein